MILGCFTTPILNCFFQEVIDLKKLISSAHDETKKTFLNQKSFAESHDWKFRMKNGNWLIRRKVIFDGEDKPFT